MVGEDILVNQFIERYETGAVSEGEIREGQNFKERVRCWRRKKNGRGRKRKAQPKGSTRKGVTVAGTLLHTKGVSLIGTLESTVARPDPHVP
jgi:hypothetical protein